jgi:hypothetical protein
MDYSNLQLRSKTFLDFTDDRAVIDEIIGDREFFLAHVTDENRVLTFMEFTDFCKDKRLVDAIESEFADDYSAIMNE